MLNQSARVFNFAGPTNTPTPASGTNPSPGFGGMGGGRIGGLDSVESSSTAASSNSVEVLNTLNEPVSETIMRDVRSVRSKLEYVLMPKSRIESGGILKKWDLWGPLILCLILSILLWAQSSSDQKKTVFGIVFVCFWVGSGIVTLNASLLGCQIPFFQSVCILGYCLFPLDIAAVICLFIPKVIAFIKLIVLGAALYGATGASVSFISTIVPADRKALAVYPVWLFYLNIAWMILLM